MRAVGMGLFFYPRGGSAQVTRYLSRSLAAAGWDVRLATGSLGDPGDPTHAPTFFERADLATVDQTGAREAFARGEDPMAAEIPMHPSYEDREGAADRVFAAVDPALVPRQVQAWSAAIGSAWTDVDLLHLHHLTPVHDAVAALWPDRPVVSHLHGTELKMLDEIRSLEQISRCLDTDLGSLAARGGPAPDEMSGLDPSGHALAVAVRWEQWRYGRWWADRMRAAAGRSTRLFTLSEHDRDLAVDLLGIPSERFALMPNGVDTEHFRPNPVTREVRLAAWRRWLVDDPSGWDRSGRPGTVRYSLADLDSFTDARTGEAAPVLLYVGRFLGFKRVPLLVRAFGRARTRFLRPAPLVIWGGAPGEWEGEHPHDVAVSEGIPDVLFVGWRGHDELPMGLSCSDLLVAPSVDEPFGQVYLEAMACGLPVIATRSGGPVSFVNALPDAENGWLVPPDDVDALADALVEAVNADDERRRRGANALAQVRASYSWSSLALRFAAEYESVLG